MSLKDLHLYYEFGGEKVIFTKEELERIKDFGPPGMTLMGFKPREALKRKHSIHHSSFMYPNEHDAKGTSMAFVALLQKMTEMNKIAICKLIARANSAPKFVALLPQLEKFDASHVQIAPPGFHVVYLPFSDDIRKLVFEEMAKASDPQVLAAKKVVGKLELKDFSPKDYENPSLQKHYANLQALALNKDQPEEIVDYTAPAVERMKKRAEDLANEWKGLVYAAGYDPHSEVPQKAVKRSVRLIFLFSSSMPFS